jgi:hypothetical protein
MRESTIEKAVNKHAKGLGWLYYKFTSPSNRGVPDMLYIKDATILLIEFKAPGKKLRPLQAEVIKKMRNHGATIYVVDSIEQGKGIFNAY